MAKKERTEYPYDRKFPPNVNPSDANRKAFSDQMEKDRKAIEKGDAPKAGPRVGEGIVDDAAKPAIEQRETTSKASK